MILADKFGQIFRHQIFKSGSSKKGFSRHNFVQELQIMIVKFCCSVHIFEYFNKSKGNLHLDIFSSNKNKILVPLKATTPPRQVSYFNV
jgi:hypothetical protein